MNRVGVVIRPKAKYILLSALFIFVTVLGVVLMIYYWHYITGLQAYGYAGAFIVALIAGSSIPIPLSYIVVTFTLGSILSPLLVGIASGVGAGTGGTLVYLFGRGGSRFIPRINHYSVDEAASSRGVKIMNKFMYWAQRRGTLVVFVMSAMFNPMFAPMAITMGALRFRMIKFFAMCVAGNIVKSLIIAYAGYFGLGTLLRWLQFPFP